MRRLIDLLFDATGYLAGLFMIGTLISVLASIFGRFHTAFILTGADAYAGYFMAASAFLALAPTLRRGEHIRVTLLLNNISKTAQRWLDIFCHIIAVLLSTALAWFAIRLVVLSFQFNDISTGLDATPLWIPQIAMAVGTSLFVIAFLYDLIQLLMGKPIRNVNSDSVPAHIE